MKKNEFKEFKSKPLAELERAIADLEEKGAVLKLDVASGKIKSLKELRAVRKSIAQINTLITQKSAIARQDK
ncbi:50S ribosomal protein L29 [Candidatus Jorgensenbacteria bacterium RIFCSPLOWO2_02_FULL_45_12]|uniref:Large ribosomal subunit protein uL29 n=2 Tax=Candidatus Joergenseniibacteriota TaxID=1752739 RepID=A0A1F6BPW5_9BACT|nr:MAG: hypothetical protein UX22_C0001G0022 [Candidatus Jorgensenbacteria bacterium GW2011_GWA2_45_9]OGG38951.1 MAG: 50S ribosomal protein L29 [Candidatus Jorgensenbacteria bacterium RIFCSPHIGHO2_02_FULL_45_20]OGG42710.1 MAG: 50S ribosomal protein L29 [Candidatus Jorgensenbacteria bacterium RIFCSPLOWO2_02_FULL_45_12]